MKIKNILGLVLLFMTLLNNVHGQNLFFIGNKSFPCSGSFKLQVGNDTYGMLSCLVAKNGTSGLFVISKEVQTHSEIRGNAIIYLDDGNVITLIDKGKRDLVDNTSTNVYNLTLPEIDKLKNSIINTVRFTIKCPGVDCISTEDGNFTGKNIASEYGFSEKERINTTQYFNDLF